MKNFYIFLDIDGVLYDSDYIVREMDSGRMKKGSFICKFKPESMQALNLLIKNLKINYNVNLIISSTWRANMSFTTKTLYDNGLIFDGNIDRTPIYDPSRRGEQILDFLKDKENFDFVIIDDEMFDFKKYFSNEKIIKCDMFYSSLSLEMVENFLNLMKKTNEHELIIKE